MSQPLDSFVASLARVVQRHHTYPPSSALCVEATEACQRTLVGQSREQFTLAVAADSLLDGETPVGQTPLVQGELTRRLRRAGVATVTVDREASGRDLVRFSRELLLRDGVTPADVPFEDRLRELGIDKLQVMSLRQPAVLDVGAPDESRLAVVRFDQERQEAARTPGTVYQAVYPAGKGWVRTDPGVPLTRLTLAELTLLVDDPGRLANMLRALADEGGAVDSAVALEERFEEIADLIKSLAPELVGTMLTRLAGSLLALQPDDRRRLLKTTVLPGFLDGRIDGAVLRQFPDVELTDALALLLDLEDSAPEVLAAALDKLDLPAERRARILPALQGRLPLGAAEASEASPATGLGAIERHGRGRIAVTAAAGKDFREFAAFDVAVDADTRSDLSRITTAIGRTDPLDEQTRCVFHLLLVEVNPDEADRLAWRASACLDRLLQRGDWRALRVWLTRFRQLASDPAADRREVHEAVQAVLDRFASPALAMRLAQVTEINADERADALQVARALGASLVPAYLSALEDEATSDRRRAVVHLMKDHAADLAPALASHLEHRHWFVVRNLLIVLGHAGPGVEGPVAACAQHADARVVREAVRALARLNTREALRHIVSLLSRAGESQALAEEALARFPPAMVREPLKALLQRRDFPLSHPALALRLFERMMVTGTEDLAVVAHELAGLRFRFWNPAVRQLGRRAAAMGRG